MQILAASASLPAIVSRAARYRCIQRQPTRPHRLSHPITARHDSDIARRPVHGGLTGDTILHNETIEAGLWRGSVSEESENASGHRHHARLR
jgi:hypothetical protein